MPAIRRYRVVETREVEVTANSLVDATRLAGAAFAHGQNGENGIAQGGGPEGVWGNTTSKIHPTNITATEI